MKTLLKIRLRRGAALPVVMAVIMVMTIAGLSLLAMARHSRFTAIREMRVMQSRIAADAGLYCAIYLVKQLPAGTWTAIESVTNVTLPGTSETYSYTVTGSPSTQVDITATGSCGSMQRTVNCKLMLYNPYWSGIVTDGQIYANNSFTFDSYPAGLAVGSIRTNSIANGSIELKNAYYVNGNLIVGPGGNIDTAIALGGGTLNGTKGPSEEVIAFPAVTVPNSLTTAGPGTMMAGDTSIAASGSYRYTGADLDKDTLTIKSGRDVTLYIDGDLDLGGKGEIYIENGATLVIYLNGNLIGTNGDGIVHQSSSPDPVTAARSVKILGTTNCKEIAVKNKGTLYASIYAPSADMQFKNSMTMYGAVTSKTFGTDFNTCNFYYIPALANEDIGSVPLQLGVSRWWE